MMMNKLKKKLSSQAGESIAETLVALLIAALALIMLAGAITTASGVVVRSRNVLSQYYAENEELAKLSSGTTVNEGIKITGSSIEEIKRKIVYEKNEVFSSKPVVAYRLSD